jgi:hypothetical protein
VLDDPIDYSDYRGCGEQQVEQRRSIATSAAPTAIKQQRDDQAVEYSYAAEVLERKDSEGRRPQIKKRNSPHHELDGFVPVL